eukprot:5858706-Prymnesium_polylepis.1
MYRAWTLTAAAGCRGRGAEIRTEGRRGARPLWRACVVGSRVRMRRGRACDEPRGASVYK